MYYLTSGYENPLQQSYYKSLMDYSAVSQITKKFEQKSKENHKIGEIKQKMMAALEEN